jgi:hypothetical protein
VIDGRIVVGSDCCSSLVIRVGWAVHVSQGILRSLTEARPRIEARTRISLHRHHDR